MKLLSKYASSLKLESCQGAAFSSMYIHADLSAVL